MKWKEVVITYFDIFQHSPKAAGDVHSNLSQESLYLI
jgi:hypothetical protein